MSGESVGEEPQQHPGVHGSSQQLSGRAPEVMIINKIKSIVIL